MGQVLEAQANGTELWLYNCSGPARSFDPYSYYLAQAWDAFRLDAKASCFWCFTDTRGVSCWNEYPGAAAGPYCPSYIDDTSVTTSKSMEAIREGSQDHEYLTMLKALREGHIRLMADPRVDMLDEIPPRIGIIFDDDD